MRHAKYNIRNTKNGPRVTSHQSRMNAGSALILTVVLTSLLAIVGVLFVMMARVNQIASSGISESKELDSAIETVIAKISDELVLDVPGVSATNPEYYDYPDVNNAWLASLEPYKDGSDYKWRQISDVIGFLNDRGFSTQNVNVKPVGLSTTVYVRDYPEITLDGSGELNEQSADADGDGIADSKWVELDDMTSSRGRPIYAAIRIIDNGGMLNVNTAYMFDPNDLDVQRIDGSSQLQINLMALAGRPPLPTWPVGNPHTLNDETDLRTARANSVDVDPYLQYQNSVIWSYGEPAPYTPFDVSDELELRYRFLLNHPGIDTRLEDWGGEFRDTVIETPVDSGGLDEWFKRASFNPAILDPSIDSKDPNYYAYRHIATTYNMDRIINPYGVKMTNVSDANVDDLYDSIRRGLLDANYPDVNGVAAQIAVNLKDYRDGDSEVTSFVPDVNGTTYYGFEQPCIYISELAHKFVEDAVDPNIIYRSYAVELYKPYSGDDDPNGWRLVIDGNTTIDIDNWSGLKQYCVILNQDPSAQLAVDSNSVLKPSASLVFTVDTKIELQRPVAGGGYVVVDKRIVPNLGGDWLLEDGQARSVQRDIKSHKCIRRLWASAAEANTPTLGADNNYSSGDPNMIQAHPSNEAFTNVGEIGMIFHKPAYYESGQDPLSLGVIGYSIDADTEDDVRVDLTEPEFQQIFNYLTVFDPAVYLWNNPNETRIKGRININTAPWFVIAQLPWMQYQDSNSIPFERAKAISDKRDELLQQGFWNIGELMLVDEMRNLGSDNKDNRNEDTPKGPDLTSDFAQDDFEERDLIFARISNLVTVRSDVFTAYILVRIGTNGPQKRVIAILDRSDVYSPTDRVQIVAVHPVPDPR